MAKARDEITILNQLTAGWRHWTALSVLKEDLEARGLIVPPYVSEKIHNLRHRLASSVSEKEILAELEELEGILLPATSHLDTQYSAGWQNLLTKIKTGRTEQTDFDPLPTVRSILKRTNLPRRKSQQRA